MTVIIAKLTEQDFNAVDGLMKRNVKWLGFLPRPALLDFLEKRKAYGALTEEGVLVGYLLYAQYPRRFRMVHLCVAEEFSGQGIARNLVENLKQSATTQKYIELHCRRDFPAEKMWQKLGFIAIGEKAGRSAAGHLLTHWYLPLARNDQQSLFQARTLDESLDVIIDAQIFFDMDEPESDKTIPSKALASDALIGSINTWVTDELFNEINRNADFAQRISSRQEAEYLRCEHDPIRAANFEEAVSKLLPTNTPSQLSDIRHISMAAASEINIFVTRDQALLRKSAEIANLTNLQVLSPTNLIIRLRELTEGQSYLSSPVSGLSLEWRRLSSVDLENDLFELFRVQGEKKGAFRERLDSYLANPSKFECELLRSDGSAVALRVRTNCTGRTLLVPFARVGRSSNRSLFERYLIASTIYKAVEENLELVKFDDSSLPPSLKSDLLATGFTECDGGFFRFCYARCLERRDAVLAIRQIFPEAADTCQGVPDTALERLCSPLSLAAEQNYFLIPIRPGYAISLVDSHQSARGLFGGEIKKLLRWENVYYRKKTHHKMLLPPARILWYVSNLNSELMSTLPSW